MELKIEHAVLMIASFIAVSIIFQPAIGQVALEAQGKTGTERTLDTWVPLGTTVHCAQRTFKVIVEEAPVGSQFVLYEGGSRVDKAKVSEYAELSGKNVNISISDYYFVGVPTSGGKARINATIDPPEMASLTDVAIDTGEPLQVVKTNTLADHAELKGITTSYRSNHPTPEKESRTSISRVNIMLTNMDKNKWTVLFRFDPDESGSRSTAVAFQGGDERNIVLDATNYIASTVEIEIRREGNTLYEAKHNFDIPSARFDSNDDRHTFPTGEFPTRYIASVTNPPEEVDMEDLGEDVGGEISQRVEEKIKTLTSELTSWTDKEIQNSTTAFWTSKVQPNFEDIDNRLYTLRQDVGSRVQAINLQINHIQQWMDNFQAWVEGTVRAIESPQLKIYGPARLSAGVPNNLFVDLSNAELQGISMSGVSGEVFSVSPNPSPVGSELSILQIDYRATGVGWEGQEFTHYENFSIAQVQGVIQGKSTQATAQEKQTGFTNLDLLIILSISTVGIIGVIVYWRRIR